MTADVDSVFENYAGVRSAVQEAATVLGLRLSADIERAVSSFGAIDGALELYIEDIADEL